MRPKRQGYDAHSETPSSHLWVGNLPFDVTDSDLMELFGKHGVIDGITCYATRSYAFIYFNRVEDAVAAKDALQGFVINGNTIKIEFAKAAKPSKHVWVGGFGSSVTKEKLEEELSKFGSIQDLKFMRDRNTALVDFVRVEDASEAVKNLNGFQIGDDRVRVDFLRSHPARREQPDFLEMGNSHFRGAGGFDSPWNNPDIMGNYPEPTYSGLKRPQQAQSFGGRKTGTPSKVLWVGYPPSVVMDQDMLFNAMILYGEIERIKSFPGRHYSFVEFRSVEEARRAKDALQGQLFNDPRITIMFSNSDLAPGKDFGPPFPGFRGHRPDVFGDEGPFRPPMMDMFPSNRPMGPNSFAGPNVMIGPGMQRPFGPAGNSDPLLPTPDFHDSSLHPGVMKQRKLSPPATGLLPSPGLSGRPGYKSSGWDVLDPNHLAREPKRSRVDGPASLHDPTLAAGQGDDYVTESYGNGPHFVGRPLSRGQVDSGKGYVQRRGNEDYIWRGVIAKGGTPVCHARCIPLGNDVEFELPEVVNCSARTGLDMLAKHHAGAVGFDIVFFLPDSEDDFANYTEFLRYLGSKGRAGVAKLDDGTTLFLVPPSDFLRDVLNVTGRERLYGVVLKLQPPLPGGAPIAQQVHQSLPHMQPMEQQLVPAMHDYVGPKHELAAQMDYHSTVPEAAMHSKAVYPTASMPQSNDGISSRPPLSLTPDLIASLQSIVQSPVAQTQVSSSSTGLQVAALTNEIGAFAQGWTQQPQILDQIGQSSQQYGSQLYGNTSLTNNSQSFSANPNVNIHPVSVHESMAAQNHVYNLQEQGSNGLRPALPYSVSAQDHQFVPPPQPTQPHSFEVPYNAHKNYGMVPGTHANSYSVADSQQPNNLGSFHNQMHVVGSSHQEMNVSGSSGNVKSEPSNSSEQYQQGPPAGDQGTAEVEVDKNQRYQQTLQFAASLLLQIQQQQQQQQQQTSPNMGNQQ